MSAMVWMVLPRPISSARMPLRLLLYSETIHWRPAGGAAATRPTSIERERRRARRVPRGPRRTFELVLLELAVLEQLGLLGDRLHDGVRDLVEPPVLGEVVRVDAGRERRRGRRRVGGFALRLGLGRLFLDEHLVSARSDHDGHASSGPARPGLDAHAPSRTLPMRSSKKLLVCVTRWTARSLRSFRTSIS